MPFITQIYPLRINQDGICINTMGHIISLRFFISKNFIEQVNMIRVNEKYTLKQEKIQVMRRLHMIRKEKKVIVKQRKDIDERLPNLSWKQNENSISKALSLIQMVRARPLHEGFLKSVCS